MAVIEHIVIRCNKQEDVTGSDDLKVYLNDIHMGNIDGISSGETRDVGKSLLMGELWVDEGTVLKIEEYTITSSDISNGSVSLRDQITSADYEFEVHIVDI